MRLLRLLLPENRWESFIGDLEEEVSRGSHSRVWYWREIILMIAHSLSRTILLAVGAGIVAGSVTAILNWAHQPPLFILLPDTLIVIGIAVILRTRTDFPFLARFAILLIGFMASILPAYFEVSLDSKVLSHPLRFQMELLAVIFGMGSVISVCAAVVSGRDSNRYLAAFSLGVLGSGAMFISLKWTNFIPMALAFALLAVASALALRQTHIRTTIAFSLLAWTVAAGLLLLIFATFARRPGDFARFWDAFRLRALASTLIGILLVAATGNLRRSRTLT